MAYQFCCPQGHLLQGELSTVGQIMRCPVCGCDFHVPPPDAGATMSEGFMQGPGMWPAPGAPSGFSFPVSEQPQAGGYLPPSSPAYGMPGTMPGMMQPLPMPGGPFPPSGFPAPQYGLTSEASIQAPVPAPAPKPPESPPAAPSAGAGDGPRFDLGFDPFAKASLPFELPGHVEADRGGSATSPGSSSLTPFLAGPPPVAPEPAASYPPPPSSWSTSLGAPLPGAEIKPATSIPIASGDDFLSGPAQVSEAAAEAPPKMLHIRCPSGHVVKAPSDLLGKLGRCPACKKTFELRYENSLEFKRRTEKILRRDENEASRAWLGWIFVAVFLAFVALAGALVMFGRH